LHKAQLMPLPLTVSCFSKIQIGFIFLVPAHLGSPGKRAVKRVWLNGCGSRLRVISLVCDARQAMLFVSHFIPSPRSRADSAKCFDERVCFCLSVALYACLRNHKLNFARLSVHVVCRPGSIRFCSGGVAIHCVLPVLWTTSCLYVIAGNWQLRKTYIYSKSLRGLPRDSTKLGTE